jgi:hypothetical protein
MFTHEIDTEIGLCTWLNGYIQKGKRRTYPAPVVQFANLLLHKAKYGIDMDNLLDSSLGFEGIEGETGLEVLLKQTAYDSRNVECPVRSIVVACRLYEWLCRYNQLRRWQANRLAIWSLGLGLLPTHRRSSKEYFREREELGVTWLVGTRQLAEDHGITVSIRKRMPRKQRR